jgi:hypothetical protein
LVLLRHPVLVWYLSSRSVIVLPGGWVRRWALWTTKFITRLLSAHLPFQALFTKSCAEFSSLLLPSSPVCPEHPTPLLCVLFKFLVYYSIFFFFSGPEVSLSRELCWFIPGVVMWVPHATYLLTCWSASPKQVWSHRLVAQEPSCFLSVTWCGDAGGLGCQSFASS